MPFNGLDQEEARELRAFFDGVLAAYIELGKSSYAISTAHMRFARVYQLVQHPRIVDAVADLLGPNVVCWGSHFFCKMPHDGKRVPWHQDSTYWPLSPTKTVTVWLAIDDADPENANMKFIPRSHLHGLIDYDETQDANTILDLAVRMEMAKSTINSKPAISPCTQICCCMALKPMNRIDGVAVSLSVMLLLM